MSIFTKAFRAMARPDGVIMKADLRGVDSRDAFIRTTRESLRASCAALDEATFNKGFKVKIFYMDKNRYRAIVKVMLYGQVAEAAPNLPAGYIGLVTEVHMKGYVFNRKDPSLSGLRDALYNGGGFGQQLSLFAEKAATHEEKGDGKGWRIGDRKSDYHFVSYTRAYEFPGIECRVKDAPIIRTRAKVLEGAAEIGMSDYVAWLSLFLNVAELGAERLERDLEGKVGAVADFFSCLTGNRHTFSEQLYICNLRDGNKGIIDASTGEWLPEEVPQTDA